MALCVLLCVLVWVGSGGLDIPASSTSTSAGAGGGVPNGGGGIGESCRWLLFAVLVLIGGFQAILVWVRGDGKNNNYRHGPCPVGFNSTRGSLRRSSVDCTWFPGKTNLEFNARLVAFPFSVIVSYFIVFLHHGRFRRRSCRGHRSFARAEPWSSMYCQYYCTG